MVLEKISRNKLIVLGVLLLIVFISVINIFPKGYIFSGGDITQNINLKNTFGHYFFVWNSASDFGGFLQNFAYSIFYLPFFFLSQLNISPSLQSFLYLFIFLAGSFLSFFIAAKRFTSNVVKTFELSLLLSIIYAINPYTLYVFTYTWGYSPFLFLYPLLPLIFGLTYSYLNNKNTFSKDLLGLGLVFFLCNIAFGNFAFCVSLILFLSLFLLFIFALKLYSGKMLYKTVAYAAIFLAATMWTIVTAIEGMSASFSGMIGSGATFNLGVWLIYQRTSIVTQFFLVPNVSYFVSNFSFLFVLGSFGFLALLFMSFKKINKLSASFLFLALVSIFITAKGQGVISNALTIKLFSLPILNTLRSPDKTLVFLPFFFLIIIFSGLQNVYSGNTYFESNKSAKLSLKLNRLVKVHIRKIVFACFILVLIGVPPFFVGGIQSRYSTSLDGGGTNYLTSSNSFLVHIPADYYDAAKILSQDQRQDKILSLPYSVINSVGWVNYPTWKVIGVDPTTQLFTKPVIQANDANTPFWQAWNKAPNNSTWILNLMSLLNVQYLMYHKDVAPQFINQTQDKINSLQDQRYISLIDNYSVFDLYNVSSAYFLPHIYPSSNITLVQGSINQLFSSIISSNITVNNAFFVSSGTTNDQWNSLLNYNQTINGNEATPQIVFQEVNPTHYQVKIENASQPFFLIFSEANDPQWKAYVDNGETSFGNIIASYPAVGVQEANSTTSFTPGDVSYLFQKALPESDHYLVNGYLNAWYIDPSKIAIKQNGTFEMTLYYQPQSYYYIGLTMSGATFAVCLIALIILTRHFKSLFLSKKNPSSPKKS
jgi:hypothetical protein